MTATSFTLDLDRHLTIFAGRTIIWEGSYEAFAADGDIQVPGKMLVEIELRVEDYDAADAEDQAASDASREY